MLWSGRHVKNALAIHGARDDAEDGASRQLRLFPPLTVDRKSA